MVETSFSKVMVMYCIALLQVYAKGGDDSNDDDSTEDLRDPDAESNSELSDDQDMTSELVSKKSTMMTC